jgi:hypothetical protein
MNPDLVYRTLVPDAPLHRRTEFDAIKPLELFNRINSNNLLLRPGAIPGLQTPRLVSSCDGEIERILFCFPSWAATDPTLVPAYQSVIHALRIGTKFIVAHHASVAATIKSWFNDAGHPNENTVFVPIADHVSLTDWAEDAYVALQDAEDGSDYLMEPWEFRRAGDALIADSVEEYSNVKASQAPLIFQGGNCLIGDDFWLLGKDYFVDSVTLLQGDRPPITPPNGADLEGFTRDLFAEYIDRDRTLHLVGTRKPIPVRPYIGTREGTDYFLDVGGNGVGTFQPIFHIDMFISLVGRDASGTFGMLVGSPAMADALLGRNSPLAMNEVYDNIAESFSDLGFNVMRNPLVHHPSIGATFAFKELKDLSAQPGYEALIDAVKELAAQGATDSAPVKIRDWHHITWNNCLVENSSGVKKNVYLPTFGHGSNADLKPIDVEMTEIWTNLGYTVHQLGDFNEFARRQGVVHCIKKYLNRGQ